MCTAIRVILCTNVKSLQGCVVTKNINHECHCCIIWFQRLSMIIKYTYILNTRNRNRKWALHKIWFTRVLEADTYWVSRGPYWLSDRGYGFLSQQNPAPNLVYGNSALVHIEYPEVWVPRPQGNIYNRRSVLYISPLEFKCTWNTHRH